MKYLLPLFVLVTLVFVVGCQKKGADRSQVRNDVTDITPQTAPATSSSHAAPSDIPAPSYTPATTVTPATPPPAATATGTTHTIRKGDTFYSLAQTHYGSGKQWEKIASANPGVDHSKLRIGQSIVIP